MSRKFQKLLGHSDVKAMKISTHVMVKDINAVANHWTTSFNRSLWHLSLFLPASMTPPIPLLPS